MKKFSFARFMQYMKLYLWANKRSYIRMLLIYVGILFVVGVIAIFNGSNPVDAMSGNVMIGYVMTYVLMSSSFMVFHKSGSSVRSLMLPASSNEKFWGISLVTIVLLPIVFIVATYLVFNLFSLCCNLGGGLIMVNDIFDMSYVTVTVDDKSVVLSSVPVVVDVAVAYTFAQLFYQFFALQFRRSQFWIAFLFNIILIVVTVLVALLFVDTFEGMENDDITKFVVNTIIYSRVAACVLGVLLVYLNWRKFKLLGVKR
ncbi:MAG: hypothetical protein R3Y61_00390 [Rikenellaceae bacterium]